jgi:hypothetical protein
MTNDDEEDVRKGISEGESGLGGEVFDDFGHEEPGDEENALGDEEDGAREDEEDAPDAGDAPEQQAPKPPSWASAPVFGTVEEDDPAPPKRPTRAVLGPLTLTEEGTIGYYLLGGANLEVNVSSALALFGSVIFGVGPDLLTEYGLIYVGAPGDPERGALGGEKGTARGEKGTAGAEEDEEDAGEETGIILPPLLAPPVTHVAEGKDEADAIRAAAVMKKLPHGPHVGNCWKIELRDIYRKMGISKARALLLMDVLAGWDFAVVYNYGGAEIAINVTHRYSQTQFTEETKDDPARWRWDEGRNDTWPKIF